MAWQIVRQPNELLACFDDIVDTFTHWDMTMQEALDLCLARNMSEDDAISKIMRGIDDIKPTFGNTTERGDGLSRWRDCLETIEFCHGTVEVLKFEELCTAC